jgi:hypothetical protein
LLFLDFSSSFGCSSVGILGILKDPIRMLAYFFRVALAKSFKTKPTNQPISQKNASSKEHLFVFVKLCYLVFTLASSSSAVVCWKTLEALNLELLNKSQQTKKTQKLLSKPTLLMG